MSRDANEVNRLVEAVGYAAAAILLGVARHTLENERTSRGRHPTPERAEAARRWLASPAALAALGQITGQQDSPLPVSGTPAGCLTDPGQPRAAFFAVAAAVAALAGAKPWTVRAGKPILTLVDLGGMYPAGRQPAELELLREALRAALRRGASLRHILALAPDSPPATSALCEDIIRYLACGDYELWVPSGDGAPTVTVGPVPSLIASGFAAVLGPAEDDGPPPGLFVEPRLADWLTARWQPWARRSATECLQQFDMASAEDILHWEEELYRDEIRPGERLLCKSTGPSSIHLDPDSVTDGATGAAAATGSEILRIRRERRRRLRQQAAARHTVRELSTWSALEAFARFGRLPRDIARRTWFTEAGRIGAGPARQALLSLDTFLKDHPKYRMKWISTPGAWQELSFEVKRPRTGDGVVYFETWRATRTGTRQVNFRCRHQGIVDAFANKFDELWASEPDTADNAGRGALARVLA